MGIGLSVRKKRIVSSLVSPLLVSDPPSFRFRGSFRWLAVLGAALAGFLSLALFFGDQRVWLHCFWFVVCLLFALYRGCGVLLAVAYVLSRLYVSSLRILLVYL